MAWRGPRGYALGMDDEELRRRIALRMRANEAMTEALASAAPGAPAPDGVVDDALESITLACGDAALAPKDRLALIDDAQRLIPLLKESLGAPGPALILEIVERTNVLLRRYARSVRGGR